MLSEKASIDVDGWANQLMVTDSTDNIWLLTELIKALDVPSPGDTVVDAGNSFYGDSIRRAKGLRERIDCVHPGHAGKAEHELALCRYGTAR